MSSFTSESGRRAVEARWAKADPDQRQAQTQPGRIAAAIKTLVDAAPELSQDQRNRLRVILTQAPTGGGRDGDR